MSRIPKPARSAFNRMQRQESAWEEKLRKERENIATKLANSNPGMIFTGGKKKIIVFDTHEDLHSVAKEEKRSIHGGGQVSVEGIRVTQQFNDDSQEVESFNKRERRYKKKANEHFQSVIPNYDSVEQVSVPSIKLLEDNKEEFIKSLQEQSDKELTITEDVLQTST